MARTAPLAWGDAPARDCRLRHRGRGGTDQDL